MNEAERLFTHLLGCDRATLYLNSRIRLPAGLSRRLARILRRRAAGEPLEYILGHADFMGYLFEVNPGVLIPRPETELLVETAVRYGRQLVSGHACAQAEKHPLRILDIGTGSGAVAVSLACLLPRAVIVATDISSRALATAEANARRHRVAGRIRFVRTQLFPSLRHYRGFFHLVVSNPPYIPSAVIKTLPPEVRREPRLALDGGRDGLAFFRRILGRAGDFLADQGMLVCEMGYDQSAALRRLTENSKKFLIKELIKDYNGIRRIVVAECLRPRP